MRARLASDLHEFRKTRINIEPSNKHNEATINNGTQLWRTSMPLNPVHSLIEQAFGMKQFRDLDSTRAFAFRLITADPKCGPYPKLVTTDIRPRRVLSRSSLKASDKTTLTVGPPFRALKSGNRLTGCIDGYGTLKRSIPDRMARSTGTHTQVQVTSGESRLRILRPSLSNFISSLVYPSFWKLST